MQLVFDHLHYFVKSYVPFFNRLFGYQPQRRSLLVIPYLLHVYLHHFAIEYQFYQLLHLPRQLRLTEICTYLFVLHVHRPFLVCDVNHLVASPFHLLLGFGFVLPQNLVSGKRVLTKFYLPGYAHPAPSSKEIVVVVGVLAYLKGLNYKKLVVVFVQI